MGKYRFAFIPALEGRGVFYGGEVNSQELAEGMLNVIANYTLYLHDSGLMEDYSNTGWIEKLESGRWLTIDEDDL